MTIVASGHIYAGLAGGGKKIQKAEVLLTGSINDKSHCWTRSLMVNVQQDADLNSAPISTSLYGECTKTMPVVFLLHDLSSFSWVKIACVLSMYWLCKSETELRSNNNFGLVWLLKRKVGGSTTNSLCELNFINSFEG